MVWPLSLVSIGSELLILHGALGFTGVFLGVIGFPLAVIGAPVYALIVGWWKLALLTWVSGALATVCFYIAMRD
jgi:hypothetical protein